jgi:hypothetical protein
VTEINPPGFLQNAGAVNTAAILRSAIQSTLGGCFASSLRVRQGVHPALSSKFNVQQAASPNMTVDVLAGVAFVNGTENGDQSSYHVISNSTKNVAITASNATFPRLDAIVLKVQDSFYSGATDSWSIVAVTGTASGSPVLPTLPANSMLIATISVAASSTSVVNGNITDNRVYLNGIGGLLPVANGTERDALNNLYEGVAVWRRDSDYFEIWDGSSSWIQYRSKSARGLMATIVSTSSSGTSTSGTTDTRDAVLGNYVFTSESTARQYRVTMEGLNPSSSVSGDKYLLTVKDGGGSTPTSASTVIAGTGWNARATGGASQDTWLLQGTFTASAGTHTLSFFAQRQSGTGVFTPVAFSVAAPRKIYVEDIGPA